MTKDTIDREQPDFKETDTAIPIKITRNKNEEPIRVTDKRFWVQPQEEGSSVEQAAPSLKPSYVEELEKKLSDSQKRLEEVVSSYRALKSESGVETQKAKERIQNEYNKRSLQLKADIAGKFINIAENLDRALALARVDDSASLLDGVRLIRGQFGAALSELGLEEIQIQGEPFNPEIAEAVEAIDVTNPAEDNVVMEVVSPGYRINNVLVRPARVKVGVLRQPMAN
jgi:molecular chaperone GrpE